MAPSSGGSDNPHYRGIVTKNCRDDIDISQRKIQPHKQGKNANFSQSG